MVADNLAREAREDRCPDRAPRAVRDLPARPRWRCRERSSPRSCAASAGCGDHRCRRRDGQNAVKVAAEGKAMGRSPPNAGTTSRSAAGSGLRPFSSRLTAALTRVPVDLHASGDDYRAANRGHRGNLGESGFNHGGSGADRRRRFGATRRAGAAAGHQAHRSSAARSQRARTRGHPGARRARLGSGVPQALASGRRDHLCPRRLAGV
jgi:hypothetical protein